MTGSQNNLALSLLSPPDQPARPPLAHQLCGPLRARCGPGVAVAVTTARPPTAARPPQLTPPQRRASGPGSWPILRAPAPFTPSCPSSPWSPLPASLQRQSPLASFSKTPLKKKKERPLSAESTALPQFRNATELSTNNCSFRTFYKS